MFLQLFSIFHDCFYSTCDSTYRQGTSCRKTQFWVFGVHLKIWSQSQFWEFTYLTKKHHFHVKIDFHLLNSCIYNNILCPDSHALRSFFKINFLQICYDVINENEITISQESQNRFQQFLHQNWAERTAI